MDKKQILKFCIIGGSIVSIISLFLPFISAFGVSQSLWKATSSSGEAYVLILFAIIAIVLPLINKKVELTYLSSGAVLTIALTYTISSIKSDVFNYLGIAYYLLFLSGLVIGISTYLYLNFESISKFSNKKINNYGQNTVNQSLNNSYAQTTVNQMPQMNNNFVQSQLNTQTNPQPTINQSYNTGFDTPTMQSQPTMNNSFGTNTVNNDIDTNNNSNFNQN